MDPEDRAAFLAKLKVTVGEEYWPQIVALDDDGLQRFANIYVPAYNAGMLWILDAVKVRDVTTTRQ